MKWGLVSGADGYVIDRKLTTATDYERVQVVNGKDTVQWTDTGLSKVRIMIIL
ncbi:MAG: hypothetical protein ACLU24_08010 [Candidatus Pseudoruminococcus sp.]